jgi:hypothetical protein
MDLRELISFFNNVLNTRIKDLRTLSIFEGLNDHSFLDEIGTQIYSHVELLTESN